MLAGIVSREEKEDLRLKRVGVLEFVDKNMCVSALKVDADLVVVADHVPRLQQQVEKI